ncbi:MAG: methylated-DNA--[protein]-cysteine S-methyltransferase [Burkholderiales bacterium]|jgi:O-6-methylguanine DNA methyltransferase|nr:methylated-DNA--[protein]-cysteine S-methyltransferase [Burkholderiales bacterium]
MSPISYTVSEQAGLFVLVAKNPEGVCAISLGKSPTALASSLKNDFPNTDLEFKLPLLFPEWLEVQAFFNDPKHVCRFSLYQTGTAFQREVWQVLSRIPCGKTLSYQQVAQELGKPQAVRAVAGACAANKLALVVPCHRVVRSNGEISGYRWGVDVKRHLLAFEAECINSF